MSIEPDTTSWTWVLDRPCPECGFDAAGLDTGRLADAIEDNATLWAVVLGTDDAAVRPAAHRWSPLEYACHVRDVNRVFTERLTRMLVHDDPEFGTWDQDATALSEDYGSQDPSVVAEQVREAASAVADGYRAMRPDQWTRTGRRDDGDVVTVDALARYHLHDLVHHAHDVAYVTKRVTVEAYDEFATAYAAAKQTVPDGVLAEIRDLATLLGPGARVLEIGSGPGLDADALEAQGLSVRRSDISRAFVRMLREAGHEADLLDPLTDDLADHERGGAAHDGVWASASLLHARREDLPTVLSRLAAVTREGGVLKLSLKEGDGARFSTHGDVAAPRHFTFWREEPLRAVLDGAGWEVDRVGRSVGSRGDDWLDVTARRR